jgi:hypothetical protein
VGSFVASCLGSGDAAEQREGGGDDGEGCDESGEDDEVVVTTRGLEGSVHLGSEEQIGAEEPAAGSDDGGDEEWDHGLQSDDSAQQCE